MHLPSDNSQRKPLPRISLISLIARYVGAGAGAGLIFCCPQVYVSVSELRNMHGNIVLSNVVAVAMVTLYLLTVYNTHHLDLYTTRACAWLAHMVIQYYLHN